MKFYRIGQMCPIFRIQSTSNLLIQILGIALQLIPVYGYVALIMGNLGDLKKNFVMWKICVYLPRIKTYLYPIIYLYLQRNYASSECESQRFSYFCTGITNETKKLSDKSFICTFSMENNTSRKNCQAQLVGEWWPFGGNFQIP